MRKCTLSRVGYRGTATGAAAHHGMPRPPHAACPSRFNADDDPGNPQCGCQHRHCQAHDAVLPKRHAVVASAAALAGFCFWPVQTVRPAVLPWSGLPAGDSRYRIRTDPMTPAPSWSTGNHRRLTLNVAAHSGLPGCQITANRAPSINGCRTALYSEIGSGRESELAPERHQWEDLK